MDGSNTLFLLNCFGAQPVEDTWTYVNLLVNDKVASYLEKQNILYLRWLVWTTDAIFRETKDRIELRKSKCAKIVGMEQ